MVEFAKAECGSLIDNNFDLQGPFEQLKYCRDRREVQFLGSSSVFPIASVLASSNNNDWILKDARSSGSTLGLRNIIVGSIDIGTLI